jgi:cytochrome P450
MLFGLDFVLEDYEFKYLNANGQFENCNMQQHLRKLTLDSFGCLFDLKGTMFPFLNDYNLCEPFTRVMTNVRELERGLKDFLSKSKDKTSYYSKVKAMDMFTEKELIADLLIMLFAGVDTTAHATVSNLYFAAKNPECAKKCRESYEENGITKNGVLMRDMLKVDKLDECEYSEYFIKEVFRLDHTAPETVAYKTLDDVEICGVPIRKDNLVSISLTGMHYDPQLWRDPLKFIPERFDPDSKYFKAPSTNKARDPLAFIPFSTGLRACPGQTMARLVQRVALPYFLSTIDYEVDKDLLENDKALFNNTSQYHLHFTVKAIKK